MIYWAILFYNKYECYFQMFYMCVNRKIWFSRKIFYEKVEFRKEMSFVKKDIAWKRMEKYTCEIRTNS
jgi:hypothetical protein